MKITLSSSVLYSAALLLQSAKHAVADELPTLPLSSDDSFNFELLIPLSSATTGGGDIAEVLTAAKNIIPGDFESFSAAFLELANKTKALALTDGMDYDPVNVRDTWFSAAKYFRRAEFYLHANWDDPRLGYYWDEQTAAFDTAMKSLPVPGERIQIPGTPSATGSNFTLETIWFPAYSNSSGAGKTPTMIITNGYDASQEDVYHQYVAAALARGWNCLTFDGPGQGTLLRNQQIGFIPDWERAVSPLVDYLLTEKADEVDPERLVLLGNSFGGYLGARAAAFEPRLSAVILDGGIWDFFDAVTGILPAAQLEIFNSGNQTAFDENIAQLQYANVSTRVRWGIDQGLWSFHTHSPYEFFNMTRDYNVKDVASNIKVPVFIADGEYEAFFPGQSELLRDAIGDLATLHVFNGTAGYHCQIGASKEATSVMFAWLNKVLSK